MLEPCECGDTNQNWPSCWAYQTADGVVHTKKSCGDLDWVHAPALPKKKER